MLLYTHRFLCVLSRIWLFVTSWTVTHQAPLSMGFSRQEYWSGSYSTSYSRGFSQAMDRTPVSFVCCLGWRILYYCTTWEALTYVTHPTINRGGLCMVGLQVGRLQLNFLFYFFSVFQSFHHDLTSLSVKSYFAKCCRVAHWWPCAKSHLLLSQVLMMPLCPSPGSVCGGRPWLRAALREPAGLLRLPVLQWLHPGRGRETVWGWVSRPALPDAETLGEKWEGSPRLQLLSFEFQPSAPSSLP